MHYSLSTAIKTGRYTSAKRTQDVLEYRQLMQQKVDSNSTLTTTTTATTTATNNNQGGKFSDMFPETSGSSQMASVSPTSAATSHDFFTLDLPSLLGGSFELSSPLTPSAIAYHMLDNLGRVDEATSPSSGVSSSSSFPPPSQSPSSQTPTSSSQTPTSSSPPPEWCPSLSAKAGDMLDDEECKRLVNYLLQSHKEHVPACSDSLSPKELLERQTACYVSLYLLRVAFKLCF